MEPLQHKRSKDYDNDEGDDGKAIDKEDYGVNHYFRMGNVHGLKYLLGNNRMFWLSTIANFVITTIYFLSLSLFTSSQITPEVSRLSIHQIPFPAITICPETKAQKSKINLTDAYHNLNFNLTEYEYDETELTKIEALTQICDSHLFSTLKINEIPLSGEKFIEILRDISIPKSEMLLFCRFRNNLVQCDEMFDEVIIDDGICYTFNMAKNADQWSLEDGYKSTDNDVQPKRALFNSNYGLNIVMSLKATDLDFICKGPVQGFKVRIHSPDERPNMMNGFFRVPLNSDIVAALSGEVTKNSLKCHTTSSKSLKFFKEYSQENCIAECLSHYVLNKCKCVKFTMNWHNDASLCTQHDTKCLVNATDNFFTFEHFEVDFPCDCKPSCVSLKYDVETSQATFDFNRVVKAFKESLDAEFPQSIMSRLSVYFKHDYYEERILNANTNGKSISEKISHVGGILAFFLGASILSLVEIFYFVVKRIIRK